MFAGVVTLAVMIVVLIVLIETGSRSFLSVALGAE